MTTQRKLDEAAYRKRYKRLYKEIFGTVFGFYQRRPKGNDTEKNKIRLLARKAMDSQDNELASDVFDMAQCMEEVAPEFYEEMREWYNNVPDSHMW